MARSKTKLEYNTFVKGLVTEAGPLTFPDNASLVDTNYVLNKDGSRQRRLGMRYELGNNKTTISSIEGAGTAVNSYTWKSVNNTGTLDIAVFQVGNSLYFYDNNVNPITDSALNGGSSVVVGALTNIKYEFAESYGKLIVATGEEEVSVLKYDSTLDSITLSTFRLKMRDLFGVDDELDTDERPSVLSTRHYYNLQNQGWITNNFSCTVDGSAVSLDSPINYTNTHLSVYPSNADIMYLGKMAQVTSPTALSSYNPFILARGVWGSTQAPRGKFILDVFRRGDSSYDGRNSYTTNLPKDSTVGGVQSVTAYSGRLFYTLRVDSEFDTDLNTPNIGSMIFFSKNTDNVAKLGECFSDNDPSSEDFNDILDTDGGFITIPDVGQIYKLATLGESLFVISSRGIWEINGGDNYFSATNQSITKTADFGAFSASSVVVGETGISFWSPGGIYSITVGDDSLRGSVQNITQNTIQSEYDDIPSVDKANVVGTYDDIAKQIRWLYRKKTLPSDYYYDTELVFDLNLSAFYVNEIQELTMTSGSSPYVVGYVDLSAAAFTDTTELVVSSGVDVQVGGVDVSSSTRLSDQTTQGSTKYWCIKDLGTGSAEFTVSGYVDLDFVDWIDEEDSSGNFGKDAEGILLTGYTTDGDAEVDKKSKYLTVFMKRTETGFTDDGSGNLTPIGESSCTLQGQWEWTDSTGSGRWSSEQEVYRLPRAYVPTGVLDPFDYGFTVVKTKNKIRGKGSALSLLFKTSPGKDLHLYGWSREVTVPEN